ncbi:MAG TPA: choline BCCT transporter BetT [Paenalcaligenes sp.]|nr:choline BCCT transporter BetT [Paenalcaligenes sp.]
MAEPTNTKPKFRISGPVFFGSGSILLFLAVLVTVLREPMLRIFTAVQTWIIDDVGWFYILTVAIILLVTVFCMLSRYGDLRLGPDHSTPEYSTITWFSMLFSAGMGIGLMFFGVAEPLMHTLQPPVGEAGTAEAAREAIRITFFHWGLHAWAIYGIVALTLAFFAYRHGLPLTLRSALYPMIGDRIYGPIGNAVDIFAVVSTVLGVATSLGFGVVQINSGLNQLFGLPINEPVQVLLIIGATALASISVGLGLDAGIRRLSELNIILAILLVLFVLILGPTVFLIKAFVQNTGSYFSELVEKTFNLYAYEKTDWLGGWTLFYWGWWLSWSPFVGMFIARVSRGRSIREFILGVTLLPTGFTFLWMTVFGDTAIDMVLNQDKWSIAEATLEDPSLALFAFLEQFPLSSVVSIIAVMMVLVFFVTSADSGALVVDMLASGGDDNTPVWQRLFWAISMGVMAIALLLADGLQALQTATLATALPFSFVLLVVIWGLLKALRQDTTKRETHTQYHAAPRTGGDAVDWQRRMRNLMTFPRRRHIERFLDDVVYPACVKVGEELSKLGSDVVLDRNEEHGVILRVGHDVEHDFVYAVYPQAYLLPAFVEDDEEDSSGGRKYFRAEVHLLEGGQDYNIMGWSTQAVIDDIIDQYERHMHYLHLIRDEE